MDRGALHRLPRGPRRDAHREHVPSKLVGGEQAYRIRIGDYRVIYTVFRSALCLEIIRVADRKDAYR